MAPAHRRLLLGREPSHKGRAVAAIARLDGVVRVRAVAHDPGQVRLERERC